MFNKHLFHKHLMKACLVAVFAIGLTACSSSDNGTANTPDPDPGPTQEELQLAALQQEIADLREQLNLDADDDIGASITALMAERDRLRQQIDDAADDEAMRMAAEMAAQAAKLYAGIGAPATTLAAEYDTDGNIEVTIGSATAVDLLEDEDAAGVRQCRLAGQTVRQPCRW